MIKPDIDNLAREIFVQSLLRSIEKINGRFGFQYMSDDADFYTEYANEYKNCYEMAEKIIQRM